MAVVVNGGARFGMTTARANLAAVNGSTACNAAPSRRCRWASSGRRSVSSLLMARAISCRATVQPLRHQQLQRPAHAKPGDIGGDMAQAAAAHGRRQIDMHPGQLADEALQK